MGDALTVFGIIMVLIGVGLLIAGVVTLILSLTLKFKKGLSICLLSVGVGVIAIGIIMALVGGSIQDGEREEESESIQSPTIVNEDVSDESERGIEADESDEPENRETAEKEEFAVVEFDTTGYTMIDAEILYEYGSYIGGENVVTVIEVSNKYNSELKANTNNNGSFFYSIVCNFSSSSKLKNVDEGDIVTIAGTVKEESSKAWDTVNLEDCEVIGTGEIADELKSNTDAQIEFCQQKQAEQDAVEAEAASAEKSAYISQCESVSYDDVARNPDKYEGKLIVVSGTVDQVSEGWFDSVTLRVKSNGNYWYVTHTREDGESRVLEGDYVTIYGECQGVKTYTTVLGSSKTIPAMRAEYID